MSLRIRGQVVASESKPWEFADARTGEVKSGKSHAITLLDGTDLHPVKVPEMLLPLPKVGEAVEVVVSMDMTKQERSMLNPYRVSLTAVDVTVLQAEKVA